MLNSALGRPDVARDLKRAPGSGENRIARFMCQFSVIDKLLIRLDNDGSDGMTGTLNSLAKMVHEARTGFSVWSFAKTI